jgi:heme-degrading monooxygenase HmoA
MPLWTVDTWTLKPGREAHFLQHCKALTKNKFTVYRDLERPDLFWSPAKWENPMMLEEWRSSEAYQSALAEIREDVVAHTTHKMEAVPDFSYS